MSKWKIFWKPASQTWQEGDSQARASVVDLNAQLGARLGYATYASPTPDCPATEQDSFGWPNADPGRGYALIVTAEAEELAADLLAAVPPSVAEDYVGDLLPADVDRQWGQPAGGGW